MVSKRITYFRYTFTQNPPFYFPHMCILLLSPLLVIDAFSCNPTIVDSDPILPLHKSFAITNIKLHVPLLPKPRMT